MSRRRGRRAPRSESRSESGGIGGGHGLTDRIESGPDGADWVVRQVTGAATRKAYRCPGCDHEVRSGQPHVVAWPADDHDAAERRHWHSACWAARERRSPNVQRGRNAPRYGR